MQYFLLFYDYVENYLEARAPHRPAHFDHARPAHESGMLVMAGAYSEGAPGAAFVFRAGSAEPIEDFARRDPYVLNGVVTKWRVVPWNVVIGG